MTPKGRLISRQFQLLKGYVSTLSLSADNTNGWLTRTRDSNIRRQTSLINAQFVLKSQQAFLSWVNRGSLNKQVFRYSRFFAEQNSGSMLGWTALVDLHMHRPTSDSLAHCRYCPQARLLAF